MVPSIEIGDVATWLATAVAIISAIAAARSSRSADRYQEEAAQHSKKSAELLEKEHQLKLREWTDQYFNSVRAWAEQVCHAISEATHIIEHPELNGDHKRPVLVKLSSLIDTGRWYFPNQWTDDYGTHKEPAYRGIRQAILDCVVVAYDLLRDSDPNESIKAELIAAQREFVSYIQEVLDPRKREQEIKKILMDFEVSERLRSAPGKR
ncbi:hypothetical protein [Vreelandella zhaodongensis]|uniref:Uncharacterized protein n=1 Tax=Vreelandella zhaodongensis TaxID=1176240 RepID=A0ABX2SUX2_VREZH|nr:hypothetical protein [Halomonas zhaodongensis]NYS45691.1 hypothetical protein [Halomonas zhaodongensis]